MESTGHLVVLRGNSGSGKSTVAKLLQGRLSPGRCVVIEQDQIRRDLLGEDDIVGGVNIELIEATARRCLKRGLVVVIEGILHAGRYQQMLARVAASARSASFFAWDLDLEETLRRHHQRPERTEFTSADMASWYHGWQPLDFVAETHIGPEVAPKQAVEWILASIGTHEQGPTTKSNAEAQWEKVPTE
jgi:predicted kinase